MMDYLINLLLILILLISENYMLYSFLKSKAENVIEAKFRKDKSDLNIKNTMLQMETLSLEAQKKEFEIKKRAANSEMQNKEERVCHHHQQAMITFAEAEKIREEAYRKISVMEQRFSKLQHELYCARQRSKKLEKQIKPVL